jgi:hypothetical protein
MKRRAQEPQRAGKCFSSCPHSAQFNESLLIHVLSAYRSAVVARRGQQNLASVSSSASSSKQRPSKKARRQSSRLAAKREVQALIDGEDVYTRRKGKTGGGPQKSIQSRPEKAIIEHWDDKLEEDNGISLESDAEDTSGIDGHYNNRCFMLCLAS